MKTPHELQVNQVVRAWHDGLVTGGYEDGIIRTADYDNDTFEVELERGFRWMSSADIEVPR